MRTSAKIGYLFRPRQSRFLRLASLLNKQVRKQHNTMAPKKPYDTTGIEYFSIPGFVFAGGTKKDIKVAYRSINPQAPKGTVLIPTCFQGRINKTFNFTSGALKDYNVVVVAMLGNSESTSPSNDVEFPTDYSLRYQVSYPSDILDILGNSLYTNRTGLHQLPVPPPHSTSRCQKSRSCNRLFHGCPTSLLLGRHAWFR